MKLSDCLTRTECACSLISEGEFESLEQCTRIHGSKALTFLESPDYLSALEAPGISCVICTPELQKRLPAHIGGVLVTETPKAAFFRIHNDLVRRREKRPTVIDPSAAVSPLAYIAPYNVEIGPGVEIQPFVTVNENSILMEGVRVCAGTVIGAQGFTVVKEKGDKAFIVLDAGKTVLEQGVQIGSSCSIECGSMQCDVTRIGAYSMIDNGVLVGHGSVIGRRGLVAAETIISGNCVFGDRLWCGVNATVSNAVTVGDDVRISLGAVVTRDVPAGETVTGNFAIPHRIFMRNLKQSLLEDTDGGQTPPPRRHSEAFPSAPRELRGEAA